MAGFNQRSTLFYLAQEEEDDDFVADGSDCLVLEGPPPSTAPNTINSEEQHQQVWWTVRVPAWKPGAEDNDANVDESKLLHDVRECYSIVALLHKSSAAAALPMKML